MGKFASLRASPLNGGLFFSMCRRPLLSLPYVEKKEKERTFWNLQALPITTIILIGTVWLLIGYPLTVLGAIFGKNTTQEFEAPVTNQKSKNKKNSRTRQSVHYRIRSSP